MKAKILTWDSNEGTVKLQLESGEEVLIGGRFLNENLFTCLAIIKNIFGLPIKRIWKFALYNGRVDEMNVVKFDFDLYHPFYALVGYATSFSSIKSMRLAQGNHAELFDVKKAISFFNELRDSYILNSNKEN